MFPSGANRSCVRFCDIECFSFVRPKQEHPEPSESSCISVRCCEEGEGLTAEEGVGERIAGQEIGLGRAGHAAEHLALTHCVLICRQLDHLRRCTAPPPALSNLFCRRCAPFTCQDRSFSILYHNLHAIPALGQGASADKLHVKDACSYPFLDSLDPSKTQSTMGTFAIARTKSDFHCVRGMFNAQCNSYFCWHRRSPSGFCDS